MRVFAWLNSAWNDPTKDLHRLLRQQLLAAVFDQLPLRTVSCRGHFPSSASGPSRMQVPLPETTFIASPHLQPSEDIWKRFYSLKFFTLPRTFNIVMSGAYLCKWTQNRRRRWCRWWWHKWYWSDAVSLRNTTCCSQEVENNISAMPPNLFSASRNLDLLPQEYPSYPCHVDHVSIYIKIGSFFFRI